MGMRRHIALGTVAACGAAGLLTLAFAGQNARPPAETSAQTSSARSSSRPWRITFEELVHNDATGLGEATVVIVTTEDDTVIKADHFTWNDKAKTARATGHLHLSDERVEGTADQADIDYHRDKRVIVLTGNVKLTLKPRKGQTEAPAPGSLPPTAGDGKSGAPQPEGKNGQNAAQSSAAQSGDDNNELSDVRSYPIEVTCDRVEYEYARDKRHAVLTGSFRGVQKLKDYTRTFTAEHAEWFGREERVVLKGPVHLEDTKGRKGETPEDVELFTTEGKEAIRLKKGVYTMPVEEEGAPPPQATQRNGSQSKGGPAGGGQKQ
jgi:lipopolysaccharide export system protein LptA